MPGELNRRATYVSPVSPVVELLFFAVKSESDSNKSDARSATAITLAWAFADTQDGITDASTTRRPSIRGRVIVDPPQSSRRAHAAGAHRVKCRRCVLSRRVPRSSGDRRELRRPTPASRMAFVACDASRERDAILQRLAVGALCQVAGIDLRGSRGSAVRSVTRPRLCG